MESPTVVDGPSSSTTIDVGAERRQLVVDPERRHLLAVLAQLDADERTSSLARTIALSMDERDSGDAEAIHLRIHHVHVPKLEQEGVVTYDEEAATVELTEEGEQLAAVFTERHRLAPA